ncbi:hypothetical protein DUI87_11903 [Hirundo rustica rustica]|uniref:Uncharacterized protein n=1 Tax=Hirundo rustica rustica TaxID=333673 RepID=A0A3M0KF12_HIRRU|nr:hypothetical protein DUI87_11903 [Hirundo rustica rustica]
MWNWNLATASTADGSPGGEWGRGSSPCARPRGGLGEPGLSSGERIPLGKTGHSQEAALELAAALVPAVGTGLPGNGGLLAIPGHSRISSCHRQAGGCGTKEGAALIPSPRWLERVLVGTTAMAMEPQNSICPNSCLGDRTPWVVCVPSNPRLPKHHGRYSSRVPLLLGLLPPRYPQLALPASISPHHPSLLPPTERFPLQVTVVKVPGVSFPALGAAWKLPSVPRLPLSSGPLQLHTGSHQLVPVTPRQGVPGTLGPVVHLPSVVHLPQLVQLPLGTPLCPPGYGWTQQVVMGTLLPHQPRAVVQEEALYHIDTSVIHIHEPALALPAGTTTMEPEEAVTTDLPEEGLAATTEAIPGQEVDSINTHLFAWPDTTVSEDTALDSPSSSTLDALLEELSEYLEDSGCLEKQVELSQQRDNEDTILDANVPSLTAEDLDEFLEFCECLLEDDHPKNPVVEVEQGNSQDAIPAIPTLTASGSLPTASGPRSPGMAQMEEEALQTQPPGIITTHAQPKTQELAAARPRALRQPAAPRAKRPSHRSIAQPARKRRRQ